MKKKILNTKRKLLTNVNSEEGNQGELNTFSGYAHKSENIAKKKEKRARIGRGNESNSSGNSRSISVLKGQKKITISIENLSEFQEFINCFNCLFYIKDKIKYFLINPEIIEIFYEKSDYHILYDLDFSTQINEYMFKSLHLLPKRKEIETIEEFCPFTKWYFKTNNHKYFYTALWSPNRVLKFNRLNDKNYGKYMNPKFGKCSNSRITKFYGPLGTGKSTLVYLFFKAIAFVRSLINSSNVDENKKSNKISLKELTLNKKFKIKIKKYKNIFDNNIEVDGDLNMSSSSEESNSDSFNDENIIPLKEIEEEEIPEEKEIKENKDTKKSKKR